ncbi:MAG TPA: sugar ABC transporter permease [Devosia sp.]|nr:sugar ABC transporter permease [Devosia sp.]
MARSITGYFFILPAMIVLALLIAYPLVYTVYLSLTNSAGALTDRNFINVMRPAATAISFVNLIYWVGASVVFEVVLGTAAAILLNQKFPGRGFVRSVTLIPWVVPSIVAATTWAWMFHTEFGIINYMLSGAGLVRQPVGWLTDIHLVMGVMVAINVWKLFPFVAVMVLAALQAIPDELYEAAKIDGANFWDETLYVTLPQVRTVLIAVTLLLVIWGLNSITLIYAITQGGPANATLITPILIFRLAFQSFQFNQAAALSVVFFAVTAVIVAIYMRISRAGEVA